MAVCTLFFTLYCYGLVNERYLHLYSSDDCSAATAYAISAMLKFPKYISDSKHYVLLLRKNTIFQKLGF